MLLQDQINWNDLDTDWLDFLRSISVDTIHLETRQMDITDGNSRTELFEKAREKVEAKGMKLNNVFFSCPREIPLGLEGVEEKIEIWIQLLESL
ncbi:MAG TPA: hypothetical protein DIC52_18245, partial [Candidatus Latescibacteria bacterium]|nr:hypothetical protein [Candidatus Latescibacterota bacterium]